MNLREIARCAQLELLTPSLETRLDVQVTGAHASDLLSDILAAAPAGGIAITVQAHLNTVAVALNARLAGVVFAAGRRPSPEVIDRAVEERVPLLLSQDGTFELSGKLYAHGLRGGRR